MGKSSTFKMVAVIKRMRKLRAKLLAIRIGPGAAVLPPEVTRIHMDFARDIEDGHYGPRKFWRNCLPRLKYHNPAVPMTVNRTKDQSGPALLTIHFTSPSAAEDIKTEISSTTTKQTSSAPVAATKAGPPTERTEVINMKHRPESEILDQNARSERDSIMMAEVNAKRKREEAILIQARGDPDALMG